MEFLPEKDMYEWAEEHGIEIKRGYCEKCGADQETTIPFKKGELFGLMAPIHDCGNKYCLISVVKKVVTANDK